MTKKRILTVLLAVLALGAGPAAAEAAVPAGAHQWEVHNADGVKGSTAYELYNQKNRSQLGFDNRVFGVDLGWVGHSGGHFTFVRNTGSLNVRDHRAIPEDENVAIYNTKTRRYLKYYERGPWKAELEWSASPVYEWQLRDQTGSAVAGFALFNDRVDKYLVSQFKNYGINLGWLEDQTPVTQSFSVALSAQPVTQGWVPYAGSFGANTRGTLLTVQNASQSATLLFVKPGKSTNDCSNPSATVPVAPRATMTADQMKALYGLATPRLGVDFLACLTTPTPQSISLTFLNLTYRLDG